MYIYIYIYPLLLFYIAENSNYKSISLDERAGIERNFRAYGNALRLLFLILFFSFFSLFSASAAADESSFWIDANCLGGFLHLLKALSHVKGNQVIRNLSTSIRTSDSFRMAPRVVSRRIIPCLFFTILFLYIFFSRTCLSCFVFLIFFFPPSSLSPFGSLQSTAIENEMRQWQEINASQLVCMSKLYV
jgi:hypothetical protein